MFDERGLKHREEHEDRVVPIPPELVAHIETFGTAPGGTFSGRSGRPPAAWRSPRSRSPLPWPAARPYDLRHAAVSQRIEEALQP
ncbi:hypothetical protein AB0K48_25110 [Nonomuraea sp. NPDC055795]